MSFQQNDSYTHYMISILCSCIQYLQYYCNFKKAMWFHVGKCLTHIFTAQRGYQTFDWTVETRNCGTVTALCIHNMCSVCTQYKIVQVVVVVLGNSRSCHFIECNCSIEYKFIQYSQKPKQFHGKFQCAVLTTVRCIVISRLVCLFVCRSKIVEISQNPDSDGLKSRHQNLRFSSANSKSTFDHISVNIWSSEPNQDCIYVSISRTSRFRTRVFLGRFLVDITTSRPILDVFLTPRSLLIS